MPRDAWILGEGDTAEPRQDLELGTASTMASVRSVLELTSEPMAGGVPRTNVAAHVSREAPCPTCSRGSLNARGHVAHPYRLIGRGAWRERGCAATRAGQPRPAAGGSRGGAGGRDDVTGWRGARKSARGEREPQ